MEIIEKTATNNVNPATCDHCIPEGCFEGGWTRCSECHRGEWDSWRKQVYCYKYGHYYEPSDGCSYADE